MRRFLFIICFLSTLSYSKAQVVKIPDYDFMKVLIELSVDTNHDGVIQVSEAEAIDSLDINGRSILDLTGIEAFTSLIKLKCYDNQLTNLDVSKNTKLIELSCENNNLTSLDVSKNIALMELSCSNNKLKTLDLSNNLALTDLWCFENKLTTLDVSKNKNLVFLWCKNNPKLVHICINYKQQNLTESFEDWQKDDSAIWSNKCVSE